jgi:hypothetical protein
MWYDSFMDEPSFNKMRDSAAGAVKYAQDVRAFHRKRTRPGERARETDIRHALAGVRRAMKPIRSTLGRAPYDHHGSEQEHYYDALREASQRLQSERRKLWKLRGKTDPTRMSK